MSDAFRETMRGVFGDPDIEVNAADLYTPRVLRRAERAARQPGAVAKIRERQREEIARELVGALRGCDEPRARELIEEARGLYSDDALAAEVERLAREDALTAAQEAEELNAAVSGIYKSERGVNGATWSESDLGPDLEEDWFDDEPR